MRTSCLIDVALNLTDCVFRGVDWSGKQLHEDDFEHVLKRAESTGVKKMIITGTSLTQSVKAIQLCKRYRDRGLYCTVGVHPAHSCEFQRPLNLSEVESLANNQEAIMLPEKSESTEVVGEEEYSRTRLDYLKKLIQDNNDVVVGVGEIGIDYAELSYCPREVQERYFIKQFETFLDLGLPFLFHSRECGDHFMTILGDLITKHSLDANPDFKGVVHSFNGPPAEQEFLLKHGLYLSLNGTAFREKEMAAQVAQIPLDRLMLETDAPWCDIRNKDYGYQYVKTHFPTTKRKKKFVLGDCLERRNEPCHLIQVVECFLGAMSEFNSKEQVHSKEELIEVLYKNTLEVFTGLQ